MSALPPALHVLVVHVDVPGVVDDYGTEVSPPECSYEIECPGVTENCLSIEECNCVHPEDDPAFQELADPGGDPPEDRSLRDTFELWDAFDAAMRAYEDVHPIPGYETTSKCWARDAIADWVPEPWATPGRHLVKVTASFEGACGPEDTILVLEPWGEEEESQ